MKRWVWLGLALGVFALARPGLCPSLRAETVKGLPAPTGYVNDFAAVIDPDTKQNLEALCTQVDQQAHAQIAVVTIKSLEGVPVEDFANQLEEKWKVGAKGTDRGILMLFAVQDKKRYFEVGYGLEGILNDAKVGDIGRSIVPLWEQGQQGQAIAYGVQQIAQGIADDAHVSLTQTRSYQDRYQEQPVRQQRIPLRAILILATLLAIIVFHGGGGSGWMFFLLGNLMGGGFGGGRGGGYGGGEGGGGFGGFGGGGSGGGGAGGDL